MSIGFLRKQLNRYDVISFDIFDTLLKRDVYKPTDVFEIVEKEYTYRYGRKIEFKTARIEAEKNARGHSSYSEITLDEIYEEADLADKDVIKALELEVESEILHCNYKIKPIYHQCIKSGKTVYVVSDMYLPKRFLESILNREGFTGYKELILSADYRETKRSGGLYKVLCEKGSFSSKEVLHIGDSWYADYIGAKKGGIKGVHINRFEKNTIYLDKPKDYTDFDRRTFFSYVNTRAGKLVRRNERLGYEVLGPVIYAYCRWIHHNYEKITTPKSKLWFAARDMYLFSQAYKLLYGDDSDFDYVYISRKSLRPILTQAAGDMTESGNIFARGEYTLAEIIKYMGYCIEDLDDPKKYDLDRTYNIRKLKESEEVKSALSSPGILEKEKELAAGGMKYLEEQGLFSADIVFADVGWHGTTQYILDRIQKSICNNRTIRGLYLGCLDGTREKIGENNYKTFMFTEDQGSEFAKGIILFESLILAPHGSTKAYKIENRKVVPVLSEPDNLSSFLSDVQRGALQFVRDYHSSILSHTIRLDENLSSEAFCKLAASPLKEELESIGQMDYDNFYVNKMADPKPMGTYMLHPKMLYKDLKYSPWRIGFLYKLFKVRLPYAKMYSFARRKQGKMT